MDTKGLTRPGLRRCAATLAAGLLLAAPLAQAQNFETYYGQPEWRDAAEDVKSVAQCPGGGSVTVATRRNGSSDQVLITRMDDNGVSDGAAPGTWQRAYPIAGAKFSSGLGIVELGERRGFAVTGTVRAGDSSRIYVMNVDCAGNMVWTTLLENADGNAIATGYDLIQSGALTSSANGDIVVVGDEIVPSQGRTFGRIVRLGLGGIPITVVVSVIVLVGWILTYYADIYLLSLVPGTPLRIAAGALIIFVNFCLSLPVAALALRPLRKLLRKMQPGPARPILGQVATIRSPVNRGTGTASVEDGGAGLILQIRDEDPQRFKRGDRVVLIEYLEDQNAYRAVSEDEFRGG